VKDSAEEEAAKYADGGAVKVEEGGDEDGEDELVVVNHMRANAVDRGDGARGLGSKATESDSKSAATPQKTLMITNPETDGMRAEEKTSPSAARAAAASRNNSDLGERHASGEKGTADVAAAMGGMGLSDVSSPNNGKTLGALKPLDGGRRLSQALPHHVPKMDSLASKMEDIRRNMGEEVSVYDVLSPLNATLTFVLCSFLQGLRAPWDSKGKPLGSIGGGKDSKK
jgi:electron transfer flavoprotein alpha subunit